jgi:hypothetical protein
MHEVGSKAPMNPATGPKIKMKQDCGQVAWWLPLKFLKISQLSGLHSSLHKRRCRSGILRQQIMSDVQLSRA